MKEVRAQEKAVDPYAWNTEYLLLPMSEKDPIILEKDLHYYEEIKEPLRNQAYCYITGVDLAISESQKADCTAMVSCKIIGRGKNAVIYILPNPINSRMNWKEITDTCLALDETNGGKYQHEFYIEDVMLQSSLVQHLDSLNVRATGIKVGGADKRLRFMLTTRLIKEGRILFPKHGCKELLNQMLNFGGTKHDDLVDAFSILVKGIGENKNIHKPHYVRNGNYLRIAD